MTNKNKIKCIIYKVEAEAYNCNECFPNSIALVLNWEASIGFGELTFIYNTETKKWIYDTEYMDEEFCNAVLKTWMNQMFYYKR